MIIKNAVSLIFLFLFSLHLCLPTWSLLDGFLNAALEDSVKAKLPVTSNSVPMVANGHISDLGASHLSQGVQVDKGHIVHFGKGRFVDPASQSVRHRNSIGKGKIE